jgi:hypothetical protein
MAMCDYCGTTILFGGVRDGDLRFCNQQCHQNGYILNLADQIPEDILTQHVRQAHDGNCPKCQGPGPVDVHTSHTVWSALVMTSWRSRPQVCCRSCGAKSKLGALASSAVLGWWGFPWGLVMTPIQILRNAGGLLAGPDPTRPSAQLEKIVRVSLASQLAAQKRQANPLA